MMTSLGIRGDNSSLLEKFIFLICQEFFLCKLPTLVRETSRTDVLDSAQDLSILTE